MKFILDTEEIKPSLVNKKEGQKIFKEAIQSGRSAVYGSYISSGLGEIKIGNLPPGKECKIILKAAFTANINDENSFFIKFPLDVVTPSGHIDYINISNNFELKIITEKIQSKTLNRILANLNFIRKKYVQINLK